MQSFFSFFTNLNCLFECAEPSDVAFVDVRNPIAVLRIPADASHAGCAVTPDRPMCLILRRRSKPQIRPSVVGRVQVYVVDFLRRPFSGHPQPNQAMCPVVMVEYANTYPAIGPHPSGGVPRLPPLGERNLPPQRTRLRVVIQNAANILHRQIAARPFVGCLFMRDRRIGVVSHWMQPLPSCGQGRRAEVWQSPRPSRPYYAHRGAA